MFNFVLKKETYEAALKNVKDYLSQNEISDGLIYLNRALEINNELINNCSINELRARYKKEQSDLLKLKDNLISKNINPFFNKINSQINQNEIQKNNLENNQSTIFSTTYPKITLKDVAGLDEVKEQIKLNILLPLKDPDLYYKYCDKVGSRILMYGPPGCGKSFIAEAIAGELKCAYAVINTYDVLSKYVGEAPRKIKEIFQEANKYEKCLIFFDELDSLFASRESDESNYSKDVLTSILTCLSGFNTNNEKNLKIIIGATNRPWILDSALLRGGRFDTHIYIGLPDDKAREFMIKRAIKNNPSLLENTDVDISILVKKFDSYSGADISSIMEKIKQKVLLRASMNKENGLNQDEHITLNDVENVMAKYRNSITKESLKAFMAFKNGEL